MDRKTLTGFILIGAILLLWPSYIELISPSEKTPEDPVLPDTTIVEKYAEQNLKPSQKLWALNAPWKAKPLLLMVGLMLQK